jgi:hypothetical protein
MFSVISNQTEKATPTERAFISIFVRIGVNHYKASSFLKKLFLLCFGVLIFSAAYSQKALKIIRMRQVGWDTENKAWSPWRDEWKTFDEGCEPVMTLYTLDNEGCKFRVDVTVKGMEFIFDVTYTGYDDYNKWYKYQDENGDEIAVVGSTISKLSLNGWPDTPVQLYFWVYTDQIALEME